MTHCVHCSHVKESHASDTLLCPDSAGREGKTFGTMNLPEGKTCGDCKHIKRCLGLGFTSSATSDECDFFPVRFVEAAQKAVSA